jgi:hypothetical protein
MLWSAFIMITSCWSVIWCIWESIYLLSVMLFTFNACTSYSFVRVLVIRTPPKCMLLQCNQLNISNWDIQMKASLTDYRKLELWRPFTYIMLTQQIISHFPWFCRFQVLGMSFILSMTKQIVDHADQLEIFLVVCLKILMWESHCYKLSCLE